jgi:hypothetical protein
MLERKFYEVAEATGSPVATEALRRIGELYAIEALRGQSPAHRLVERRSFSKPIVQALHGWLEGAVPIRDRERLWVTARQRRRGASLRR